MILVSPEAALGAPISSVTLTKNTPDEAVVRADFRRIAELFRELRTGLPAFRELSIGMSVLENQVESILFGVTG